MGIRTVSWPHVVRNYKAFSTAPLGTIPVALMVNKQYPKFDYINRKEKEKKPFQQILINRNTQSPSSWLTSLNEKTLAREENKSYTHCQWGWIWHRAAEAGRRFTASPEAAPHTARPHSWFLRGCEERQQGPRGLQVWPVTEVGFISHVLPKRISGRYSKSHILSRLI